MTPAKIVPAVLGVLLALALAFAGIQTVRLSNERTAHAVERTAHESTKRAHAEELAAREKAAREAVQEARAEEQRRTAAVQEIADEAQKQLDAARDDADDARLAGQRLRNRVAELTAALDRSARKNPAAASPGAPAQTTSDLLADVQRRLDEAQDRIAEFADKAHAAGKACERAHDALTAPQPLGR